jgi:HEAT repeat protein
MRFLKYFAPIVVIGALLLPTASTCSADKNPPTETQTKDNYFPVPEWDSDLQQCVDECLHQNQQAAVGFNVLEQRCRQACQFEKALQLSLSSNKDERIAGIKDMCASKDSRAVQPLISALKTDLTERTGVWAWIIPALGDSRDQRAVPILTQTLTIMDDDWLGREMSARALGDIGDPSSVPYLLAAAWRADTRGAAIEALAKYQDKRVIPVLISALDPAEDNQTREAAITGLHQLGSMAVPEMLHAFTSFSPEYPDTQKRLWLCDLLGSSGDERAMKVLHDSSADPDRAIAECAEKYASARQ